MDNLYRLYTINNNLQSTEGCSEVYILHVIRSHLLTNLSLLLTATISKHYGCRDDFIFPAYC